jgi:hypothetical protein
VISASIARVAEERAQLGDALLQVAYSPRPLALERGQRARRRSRIADAWISDSSNASIRPSRLVGVVGAADQRDHLVEVVERDQIALEDVRALLALRSSNFELRVTISRWKSR